MSALKNVFSLKGLFVAVTVVGVAGLGKVYFDQAAENFKNHRIANCIDTMPKCADLFTPNFASDETETSLLRSGDGEDPIRDFLRQEGPRM